MAVYQRPADLARAQQRRFDAMKLTQKVAHKELVDQGTLDHKAFTSGGISENALEAMGHPFAREGKGARGIVKNKGKFYNYGNTYSFQSTTKKGVRIRTQQQISRGRVNPLPINKQTGELHRSYFRSGYIGSSLTVRMGFKAPHAKEVLSPKGTKKMIYRGFYSKSKTSKGSDQGIIARRHRARSSALIQSIRKRQRKSY